MDQKTIAWVSYITIIGWIVALVSYNSSPDKSSLARFHLRQVLGIWATGCVFYIVLFMIIFVVPFLGLIFPLIWIALFVLWILGLIAAINGEEKPLPVVGELYQRAFSFIK